MTANYITNAKFVKTSCRICLESLIIIYNEEIKGKHKQLFEDCIGVTIINGSTLICDNCAKKLEDFDKFKKIAQTSNDLWNSRVYFCDNSIVKVELESEQVPVEPHFDVFVDKNECLESLCDENDTSTEIDKSEQYQSRKKLCKKKKPLANTKAESKFECGLCSHKSSDDSLQMINKHVDEHYSSNDLNCRLCKFQGFDFADMESHRFVHQPQIKTAWCHICNKKTISKTALTFHFRVQHISKNNVCACRYCNKSYRNYKKWKLHQRSHTDAEKFQCDVCGREFINKSSIKAHIIETHLRIGCICYICGKKVGRRQYLKAHVKMVHGPSHQSIKCSHCNRTFKSHDHLEIHMARLNRSFTCPYCPKVFNDKNYRNKHILFHTGARPFQCNLCKASYKVKSMLKIHMRKHTGERPFVCGTCGKGFTGSQSLKRHMSTHSGNRGKQCLYCDRSFYYRNLLNAHMLKAHAQDMQCK